MWRKPALVLREVTERPEGVQAGIARVVGSNETEILRLSLGLVRNDGGIYTRMSSAEAAGVYGHGNASEIVAQAIVSRSAELMARSSTAGRRMDPVPAAETTLATAAACNENTGGESTSCPAAA